MAHFSNTLDAFVTREHIWRIRIVGGGLLLAFLVVAARLCLIQFDPDERLAEMDDDHFGKVRLMEPRGDIRDHRGLLLATDKHIKSLWADPLYVEDIRSTAFELSGILNVPEEEIAQQLYKTDEAGRRKRFVWLKRDLTDAEVQSLGDLKERYGKAVGLQDEAQRFYPQGALASHVLGFANREGAGCEGVELAFDKHLRCVPGVRTSRVDARRNVLSSLTIEYVEPTGGNNVILTIDSVIQHALERELDKAMVEHQAPRAMGVVMDPKTGAILALACRPAFDPNDYGSVKPEIYKNRAVVDVFEPGSAFKIVTASAGLENGLITPETIINCERGSFNPYGHRIRDHHAMAEAPFWECFTQSSNIAMIKVAAMLGPEKMENWIVRFGFGQKATKDIVHESKGLFRPIKDWSRLTMGSLPIGQEIAVNIVQLARAFSAIANGGSLVEPYLVERVMDRDGVVVQQHELKAPEQIMSPKTAETMRELCYQVVAKGTGKRANIPEYRVGGKTGTAQMARTDGRGYDPGKYTAVFAGFAPVADPKIASVIVVQEPGASVHFGGVICAPVFREVAREALVHLHAAPDPCPEGDAVPDSQVQEDDADTIVAKDTQERETAEGLTILASAGGKNSKEKEPSKPALPSFAGMTRKQAREQMTTLGLNWETVGSGRVVEQDPPAGTPLEEVTFCRVTFSSAAPEAKNEPESGSKTPRL